MADSETPNFSAEVNTVLDALSLHKPVNVVGSATQKNVLYAGDYDCNETVLYKSSTVSKLKKLVRKVEGLPYTYVLDFKAGLLPTYAVLTGSVKKDTLVGFDKEASLATFSKLKDHIPTEEYTEGVALLEGLRTAVDWLKAKAFFKYHILHWTCSEIYSGEKKQYGETVTLAEALLMPSPVKIDVVSLVNSKFVEFSCIYFIKKGRRYINPPGSVENLEEDAIVLLEEKNYYKYLKRVYSLSLINKNKTLAATLEDFFNSKNGMLYVFIVCLETLLHMYENIKNLPLKKVQYELDLFKNTIMKFGKEDFAEALDDLQKRMNVAKLRKLHEDAYTLLQTRSAQFLQSLG